MKRANAAGFTRRIVSPFVLLFVLLLSSFGLSCRTIPPRAPDRVLASDDPRALALLASWIDRAGSRTGLRGRTAIAVDSADGQVAARGKQVLVVQRPAQLRVEILGFLNQALAVVVTDGDQFEVLRTQDRSYQTGELTPTLLWDEARIALTTEEAIAVLLGAPVPDPSWAPRRITMDASGLTWIDLADDRGVHRQRLSFDSLGYLSESQRFDATGSLVWRARFDDYREVGGNPFAHAIELDVAIGATHAEISLRDIELNPVLSEDIFRLRRPGAGPADGERG